MCSLVTGVQTCALPVSGALQRAAHCEGRGQRGVGDELEGAEGEAALRRPQRAVQGDVDLDGLRVEAVVGQLEAAETRREVGGMSGLAVEAAVQRHREGAGGNGEGVRSEEHPSELQSLMRISYAVFCLKKKQTH